MSHPNLTKYYRSDIGRQPEGSAIGLVMNLVVIAAALFAAVEFFF